MVDLNKTDAGARAKLAPTVLFLALLLLISVAFAADIGSKNAMKQAQIEKQAAHKAAMELQKEKMAIERVRITEAVKKIRQAYADKTGKTVAGIKPSVVK